MKPRCVGAIALGLTGNAQGGVKSFSLYSGRVIDCQQNDYDLLPLPADAIVCVEWMTRCSPIGLLFANRNNILDDEDSDDENNDPTYVPSDHSDNDSLSSNSTTNDESDIDTIITGVDDDDDDDNKDNDDNSDNDTVEEGLPPRNEDNNNNDNKDWHDNNINNITNTPQTRSGRPIRKNQDTDRYEYQHLHIRRLQYRTNNNGQWIW